MTEEKEFYYKVEQMNWKLLHLLLAKTYFVLTF